MDGGVSCTSELYGGVKRGIAMIGQAIEAQRRCGNNKKTLSVFVVKELLGQNVMAICIRGYVLLLTYGNGSSSLAWHSTVMNK